MGWICAYHSCKRRIKRGIRCRYCHKGYCDEHRNPQPPSVPFGKDHDTWAKRGHPCPDYVAQYKLQKEEEEERIRIATKKLIRGESSKIQAPYIRWPENKCVFCEATFSYVLKKCQYCFDSFCEEHMRMKDHNCPHLPKVPGPQPPIEPEVSSQDWYKKIHHWFFTKKRYFDLDKKEIFLDLIIFILAFGALQFLLLYPILKIEIIWHFTAEFFIVIMLWLVAISRGFPLLINLYYAIRGLANGYRYIAYFLILVCAYLFVSTHDIGSMNYADIDNIFGFPLGPSLDIDKIYQKIQSDQVTWEKDQRINQLDFNKKVERVIFDETNKQRQLNGLPPLSLDPNLSDIAREHSQDMADKGYFDHTNRAGEGPTERAERHGYPTRKMVGMWTWVGIAENIGKMPTGDVEGRGYVESSPEAVGYAQVDSWMHSPGHKSNILGSDYDVIGIGVAFDGRYYTSTQDFK